MGWLVYPLGTSDVEPRDGAAITASPRYFHEHPKDTYGDALILPCEFFADGQHGGPVAHLPEEGQPQ